MLPNATDLREACVVAAHAVIAERGIEKLSLREVARELGVSHQAPYKHYPSRDHLLAEVMKRCFQRFAAHLSASLHGIDPETDMDGLGRAYLQYAMENPLEYRLMFGTPWPDTAQHTELLEDARHSFDVLREARDLLLHLLEAAVGAPAADFVFELAFFHDLHAKSLGRALEGIGIELVFSLRSDDQEPVAPLLPYQVLRQPVSQHGTCR